MVVEIAFFMIYIISHKFKNDVSDSGQTTEVKLCCNFDSFI